MKLAFATLGCPSWSIEQIAERAQALGFDGVELRGVAGEHVGPDETDADLAAMRELFQARAVEVLCIMGYTRFTEDDSAARKEGIDTACRFLDVAQKLACPVLRVFGGGLPESGRDQAIRNVIEGLKAVTGKAERAGVTVAIETHDDWCKGENLRRVLDGVGSPALGICWDVGNSFTVEPPETTLAAIEGHIAHVHFKDVHKTAEGTYKSILPGTGIVPLAEILGLLHGAGYASTLSFEWEKKWEPELEAPEIAFPHFMEFTTRLMAEAGVPRG